MAALADRAAALAGQYQNRPEAAIWHGIIISEQASIGERERQPLQGAGFAKRAREILEPIATSNPFRAGRRCSGQPRRSVLTGCPASHSDSATRKRRGNCCKKPLNTPRMVSTPITSTATFLYEQHEYPEAQRLFKHALFDSASSRTGRSGTNRDAWYPGRFGQDAKQLISRQNSVRTKVTVPQSPIWAAIGRPIAKIRRASAAV